MYQSYYEGDPSSRTPPIPTAFLNAPGSRTGKSLRPALSALSAVTHQRCLYRCVYMAVHTSECGVQFVAYTQAECHRLPERGMPSTKGSSPTAYPKDPTAQPLNGAPRGIIRAETGQQPLA